jgi:hypothetical protein
MQGVQRQLDPVQDAFHPIPLIGEKGALAVEEPLLVQAIEVLNEFLGVDQNASGISVHGSLLRYLISPSHLRALQVFNESVDQSQEELRFPGGDVHAYGTMPLQGRANLRQAGLLGSANTCCVSPSGSGFHKFWLPF